MHRGHLTERIRVGAVHDVQQQIGVHRLLQGRAERFDQVVGQMPDEPDGVSEGVHAAVCCLSAPGGGVEGGEERVLNQHARTGQPVEQRTLARVRVPDDRHAGHLVARALRPLGLADGVQLAQPAPQHLDAGLDAATVGLDLGLARTTATDTGPGCGATTSLAG